MTSTPYPIRLDAEITGIPRWLIEPYDAQCTLNHGHSLAEMETRYGGLTPEEAVAIIESRPFERMPMTAARQRLQELMDQRDTLGHARIRSMADAVITRCERMRDGILPPHRALFNMVLEDLRMIKDLAR